MEPSTRDQVFRAGAALVGVAVALFALSYVLEPSIVLAAALGITCVAAFAGVVLGVLDDRFGLVWLSLGVAAVVVFLSVDASALRETTVALLGLAVAAGLLWFVPAKAAELGERLGE